MVFPKAIRVRNEISAATLTYLVHALLEPT